MRLRSIELELPEPDEAHGFLAGVWGAHDAGIEGDGRYVRGSGPHPYLIGLHRAPSPAVRTITFVGSAERVDAIATAAPRSGVPCRETVSDDPGGGRGIEVTLPEGERFRFLSGANDADTQHGPHAPVRLTHVVMNSVNAEASAQFCEDVLGFRVSDRTKGMVFVRCNEAHHSVAFARTGFSSLNHIAFEMADLDNVMRGIGRMRDAGYAPSWGPGRHGPGDNVFAYFIAPFGAVVEFSTPVETVGDDYPTGAPEDWTWPPGRIDQWGMSDKDVDALREAERRFRFNAPQHAGIAA